MSVAKSDVEMDLLFLKGILHSTLLDLSFTDFSGGPFGLLTRVNVSTCAANIHITDLDFQGDFIAKILDLFKDSVKSLLEEQINVQGCTMARNMVENNVCSSQW